MAKFWDEIAKLTGKKPKKNGIAGTGVAKLFTRKELGNYPSLNMKLTDPLAAGEYGVNIMGREGRLFSLKRWLEQVERDLKKSANAIMDNNYSVGSRLKNNLEYNLSLRNKARKEISRLETAFVNEGKTVDQALKEGEQIVMGGKPLHDVLGTPVQPHGGDVIGITGIKGDVESLTKSAEDLKTHIEKIKKSAEELKNLATPETQFAKAMDDLMKDQSKMAKLNHEGYYRSMVQPLLLDAHKKGLIKLDQKTIDSIKTGGHHNFNQLEFPDPVDVYKYHFNDPDLVKIAPGNTDGSTQGILKWIEESGMPEVAKKEGFKNQGKYLSRQDIEEGMKEAKDRYGWARDRKHVYSNMDEAQIKESMIREEKNYGKYEQLHDQLEIPERAGQSIQEGMGQPNSVYKSYDDKGKIKTLIKRITDPETKDWKLLEYDVNTGMPKTEHMSYGTTRDLTKPEKVYKPEKIEEMKSKLLEIESIQPPFAKQYDKRLLDTLEGEQLEELLKREANFKKNWTKADEADLAARKIASQQQERLQSVESMLGKEGGVYDMSGKLTAEGKEGIVNQITEIDDILNNIDELGVTGDRKESLMLRLQDKSSELQNLLKLSDPNWTPPKFAKGGIANNTLAMLLE